MTVFILLFSFVEYKIMKINKTRKKIKILYYERQPLSLVFLRDYPVKIRISNITFSGEREFAETSENHIGARTIANNKFNLHMAL